MFIRHRHRRKRGMPEQSSTQQHVAGKSAGTSAAQIHVSDDGYMTIQRKEPLEKTYIDITIHRPYAVRVKDFGSFAVLKFYSGEEATCETELSIFFDDMETMREVFKKVIEIIDSGKAKRNNE